MTGAGGRPALRGGDIRDRRLRPVVRGARRGPGAAAPARLAPLMDNRDAPCRNLRRGALCVRTR